jgi:hypothetical protein
MSLLSGMRYCGTAQPTPEGGSPMKQFKDVNACIADLQALLARSDIGPEQKKDVGAAIEQLRRLRRKPNATMPDVYRCVRDVAGRLISAFVK